MQKNNPSGPKTPLKTRITLIIFGLFLSVIFLETALRLGGMVILSQQKYRNLQTIKQKDTYRIMCLGESTTQRQYPVLLEEILNQRNIGIKFSVIDKGRIGIRTPELLKEIDSNINKYHPDMVVTMIGINDEGGHLPYEAPTASKMGFLFKSFRVYKLSRLLWLHILTKAEEIRLYKLGKDKQDTGKIQTRLPGIKLKGAYVEPVSDEGGSSRKAIGLDPKDSGAYIELGRLYRDQGKYSYAELSFKKAIGLDPKDSGAYRELGQLYRCQGKYSDAELSFKKAIGLDHKDIRAYRGLGRVYHDLGRRYHDQGKYSHAEGSFRKTIELNPEDDGAYRGLGQLYRCQGKYSDAELSFKKAIGLDPKDSSAYRELGRLYRCQGKYSQAEGSFRKAIELDPEDDGAYGAISTLYAEIGRPELAKKYAKKANSLRLEYYDPVTVNSYRKLKEILDKKKIRLVCVQYPVRSIEPLKKVFEGQQEGILFVDNESIFKDAIKTGGFNTYFIDIFGGDFGHCTEEGNRLLAEKIANVILEEIFGK